MAPSASLIHLVSALGHLCARGPKPPLLTPVDPTDLPLLRGKVNGREGNTLAYAMATGQRTHQGLGTAAGACSLGPRRVAGWLVDDG